MSDTLVRRATFDEAMDVYTGSNGDKTRAFYQRLSECGPRGHIAMNVFRACKTSERAKNYRGRYSGAGYDTKQWSMENICKILTDNPGMFVWGWQHDPATTAFEWVLYVELPTGQVSFHTSYRIQGPDYPGRWDGVRLDAPRRICLFCADVLDGK